VLDRPTEIVLGTVTSVVVRRGRNHQGVGMGGLDSCLAGLDKVFDFLVSTDDIEDPALEVAFVAGHLVLPAQSEVLNEFCLAEFSLHIWTAEESRTD